MVCLLVLMEDQRVMGKIYEKVYNSATHATEIYIELKEGVCYCHFHGLQDSVTVIEGQPIMVTVEQCSGAGQVALRATIERVQRDDTN